MKDIAVNVFKVASILFGIIGIIWVFVAENGGEANEFLAKSLGILVFILLSSFAIAVAEKYLKNGKK